MTRRLYTEASVRDMPRGSELVLDPGDVATPSALDLAFARGIRVSRSGSRARTVASTASVSSGEAAGVWREMLATDGTYVVEVRRGSASVHRLTAEGPVALSASGGGR